METLNKVILIGHVTGHVPKLRETHDNTKVTNFTLVTIDKWKDKKTGKIKTKKRYHNIVAWEAVAERVCSFVKSGMCLYLEGSLSYKNDNNQYCEIKISRVDKFSNK